MHFEIGSTRTPKQDHHTNHLVRRICPGLHYADSMLYIVIVSLLATFDISKPRDESGKEVELDVSYSMGLL